MMSGMASGQCKALAFAIVASASVAACAAGNRTATSDGGRILTYTRANSDGSEAETVRVFRASSTRIEVIKTRQRCTSAAFVSAELDPSSGDAVRLTGGRLLPNSRHSEEAWLVLADGQRLDMHVGDRDAAPVASIPIMVRPWHLFDFDLATLAAAPPRGARAGQDFSFGLALSLVQDDGLDLRWLGPVEARFAGTERLAGHRVHRFAVSGPGLPGRQGGTLWTDTRDGYIVRAAFGLPNHVEYKDFSLTLTDVSQGALAWRDMLEAHYRGCPAPAEG